MNSRCRSSTVHVFPTHLIFSSSEMIHSETSHNFLCNREFTGVYCTFFFASSTFFLSDTVTYPCFCPEFSFFQCKLLMSDHFCPFCHSGFVCTNLFRPPWCWWCRPKLTYGFWSTAIFPMFPRLVAVVWSALHCDVLPLGNLWNCTQQDSIISYGVIHAMISVIHQFFKFPFLWDSSRRNYLNGRGGSSHLQLKELRQ